MTSSEVSVLQRGPAASRAAIRTLERPQVLELDDAVSGRVVTPDRPDYEAARKLFNGGIDRRPAAIVYCTGTHDVVAALAFARRHGLEVSIRSGGHGVSGSALGDGVITIDVSAMKAMTIDPVGRVARVEAGVTWGELDTASQAYGLAVTGGRVSTTGVAGLTLGSGSGWLERTIGFTCDNLLSADVVTADGSLVHANDTENPDLFWALRGGGGNFGIVTGFAFRLHPVGPVVLGGSVVYPLAAAREVLRAYRDFMAQAPDQVGGAFGVVTADQDPALPEHARGRLVVSIAAVYFGPVEEGERILAPLRSFVPPLADKLRPLAYTALQRMNENGSSGGLNNYFKADFLHALTDEAIDTFVDLAGRITSPDTALLLQPLGGALSRVHPDSTPLGRRDAAYAYHALSAWAGADHDRHIAWTRALAAAMRPFATSGVYLTYIGDEGEERVREAYGPVKYARLVAIKDRYDPDNVFNRNQNIRPSALAQKSA